VAEALQPLGELLVVAPDKQQSGVGSCVSLHADMSTREAAFPLKGVRAYAVGGTPNDCVMLGLKTLTRTHIDLLVSGINHGPNVGRDILYSGTVMATLPAYYRKIPSIAVSQYFLTREEAPDFRAVTALTQSLAKAVASGALKTEAILNVNAPNLPPDKIRGVKVARTAETGYVSLSSHRHEGEVKYTLQLDGNIRDHLVEGTDIWAIHNGYISVTPLQFNITDSGSLASITESLKKGMGLTS
jgi:5'-nucleotidase